MTIPAIAYQPHGDVGYGYAFGQNMHTPSDLFQQRAAVVSCFLWNLDQSNKLCYGYLCGIRDRKSSEISS
jgi:hypothetical protein